MDGSIATVPNKFQELETILASVSKLQKQIEPITAPVREIQKQLNPIIEPMLEMQKQLEPIVVSIKKILAQYPVKRAALFGSATRQDMTELSDIDMLIEFAPGSPGLDFYGLGVDLEEALGCRVDLLTWNALRNAKPDFRQNVESEARLIYESERNSLEKHNRHEGKSCTWVSRYGQ